jgi:hypothetical protein
MNLFLTNYPVNDYIISPSTLATVFGEKNRDLTQLR